MRAIAKAFARLALSSVAGQAIGFVALAYVARRVPPAGIGAYSYAVAITGYFALAASVGVPLVAVRDLASANERHREVTSESLSFLMTTNSIAYLLLLLLAPLLAPTPTAAAMLRVVGLILLSNAVLTDWFAQARQQFTLLAICRLLGQLVYGAMIVWLAPHGGSGAFVYAWANVTGFFVVAVSLFALQRRTGRFSPRLLSVRKLSRMYARAAGVGVVVGILQVYLAIPILVLGWLSSTTAVATYSVANRLPNAFVGVGYLLGAVLLPKAADSALGARAEIMRNVQRLLEATAVAFIMAIGFMVVNGPTLATAMFGKSYRSSGSVMAILVAAAGLLFADSTLGNTLLAQRQDRVVTRAVGIGGCVSLAVAFPAVSSFSAIGAAASLLCGEVCVFVILLRGFRRAVEALRFSRVRLARAAACAAGAVVLASRVPPLPSPAQLLASGAIFVVAAIAAEATSVVKLVSRIRDGGRAGASRPETELGSNEVV